MDIVETSTGRSIIIDIVFKEVEAMYNVEVSACKNLAFCKRISFIFV